MSLSFCPWAFCISGQFQELLSFRPVQGSQDNILQPGLYHWQHIEEAGWASKIIDPFTAMDLTLFASMAGVYGIVIVFVFVFVFPKPVLAPLCLHLCPLSVFERRELFFFLPTNQKIAL